MPVTRRSNTRQSKEGVVPARKGERRQAPLPLSQAQAPTLALASIRAGAKTLESASTSKQPLIPKPDILDEDIVLMDTAQPATEKVDLLRLRQLYKKTVCNFNKVCSHLDFITACTEESKTPNGLKIRVKCNALLKDLTAVEAKFKDTKQLAEAQFTESLKEHYIQTQEKLSQKIVKIEHNITLELENSTQEEAKTHEDMMKKTVDNIKKQQQRLNETKKRKLEELLHPPEKRSRQGEQMRKWSNGRNYQRQTQTPYHKRNQQKQSNSTNPKNTTSTPYQTPHSNSSDMATLANLIQKLITTNPAVQQQPPLLTHSPCAAGQQQPQLFAPAVSVLAGQPPPLSGQCQQGPCAVGRQQPQLFAPAVSVLAGQPPPLSGRYQQGF